MSLRTARIAGGTGLWERRGRGVRIIISLLSNEEDVPIRNPQHYYLVTLSQFESMQDLGSSYRYNDLLDEAGQHDITYTITVSSEKMVRTISKAQN